MVCTAGRQDRDARTVLLATYLTTGVRFVFADGAFAGRLLDWAQQTLRTTLHILLKPAGQRGFAVIPRRWAVERTLACSPRTAPGPRLRTRPRRFRGHDLLGRDRHHHSTIRPRPTRNPKTPTRHPTRQLISQTRSDR